jgi:hypothetical protein
VRQVRDIIAVAGRCSDDFFTTSLHRLHVDLDHRSLGGEQHES